MEPEARYDSRAFQRQIQSALLLALLERGLLTRSQFERCLREMEKKP